VDQSGYTGQFYRPNQNNLEPILEAELVKVFFNNNKKNKLKVQKCSIIHI
jgi:hypothetical protein